MLYLLHVMGAASHQALCCHLISFRSKPKALKFLTPTCPLVNKVHRFIVMSYLKTQGV